MKMVLGVLYKNQDLINIWLKAPHVENNNNNYKQFKPQKAK